MTTKRCVICKLAALLGGLGALNWGLVALFNFNLVDTVLGQGTTVSKVVYVVVGVAGLLVLLSLLNLCPCTKDASCCAPKK
jgi:uncharacterized membrane protein YuzA (DUF378 family)